MICFLISLRFTLSNTLAAYAKWVYTGLWSLIVCSSDELYRRHFTSEIDVVLVDPLRHKIRSHHAGNLFFLSGRRSYFEVFGWNLYVGRKSISSSMKPPNAR